MSVFAKLVPAAIASIYLLAANSSAFAEDELPYPIVPETVTLKEGFSSPDAAAAAASQEAWALSENQPVVDGTTNGPVWEFSGVIYRAADGSYGYTSPRTAAESHSNTERLHALNDSRPMSGLGVRERDGSYRLLTDQQQEIVAVYHTHPRSTGPSFDDGKAAAQTRLRIYTYNELNEPFLSVADTDRTLRAVEVNSTEEPKDYRELPFVCAHGETHCRDRRVTGPSREGPSKTRADKTDVLAQSKPPAPVTQEQIDDCDAKFPGNTMATKRCIDGTFPTEVSRELVEACDQKFPIGSSANVRCINGDIPSHIPRDVVEKCDQKHRPGSEANRGCMEADDNARKAVSTKKPTPACVNFANIGNRSAGSRGADGGICAYSCSQLKALTEGALHNLNMVSGKVPGLANFKCAECIPSSKKTYEFNLSLLLNCCTGGKPICK